MDAAGFARDDAWIPTSGAHGGVIDFDAVTRDPEPCGKFLNRNRPGDYLHPDDAGFLVMADAIDLSLFES